MNNKSLSTLEYNKIISRLVSFACSDGAKQILHKLEPMTDIDKINTALDYTNDALTRVYQKGSVDFSRIKDIRGSIARLKVGSSLNALELLNISMLLECAAHIKGYYEQRADSIQPLIDMLDPVTLLNNTIKKCIISEDEISDDIPFSVLYEKIHCYIQSGYSTNEAIKKVAKDHGLSKNEVYKQYHSS